MTLDLSEARSAFAEADRAYRLARRILQGQRLLFADMVAAGIPIPKHCRETHRVWLAHAHMLRLALEHARANVAMAEVLSR